MSVLTSISRRSQILLGIIVVLFAALPAMAQMAPTRTIDELKAETQRRVDKNLSPVGGIKSEDAREALANIHSLDRDEWAAAWSAVGERYEKRAKSEEASGDKKAAQTDYQLAFRYYTVGRWPVPNSPGKEKAYQSALAAFRNYVRFLDPPVEVVRVPFEGKELVLYVRVPKSAKPVPVALLINGTDSRKEDLIPGNLSLLRSGIGMVAVDMPGTGEAPLKAGLGAVRMYSRVLDFIATRQDMDAKHVAAWGVSWGGHWAAYLAYSERARLVGTVVQGGPIDAYFSREWQEKSLGTPEYLFDLFAARSAVYGVKTLDEFFAYGPRLSLKAQGFIGQPSAPMLIVNGAKDSQTPIADLYVLLESGGSPKQAWVNPEGGHTGRSTEWPNARVSEEVVIPWIKAQLQPESVAKHDNVLD
jgi:esterase FrsA